MGGRGKSKPPRVRDLGPLAKAGRSVVAGASLEDKPKALALRYLLAVRADSNGAVAFDIQAFTDDVTHYEVGRALLALAGQSFQPKNIAGKVLHSFQIPIERQDLVNKKQHKENVLRDYPAMRFHPAHNWYLCAACLDVYTDTAAPVAEFLELPEEMGAVACTFHFDDSKRPFTYEHAAELKMQLEEDRKLAAEDAARKTEAEDDEGTLGEPGPEGADAAPPDAEGPQGAQASPTAT